MSEILSTLVILVAALGNVRSSAAVREHVALIQDKLAFAVDENAKLQDRIRELEEEVRSLRERSHQQQIEIESYRRIEEYTEHRGALFKKIGKGGYHATVYCPACRKSTYAMRGRKNFACSACGWISTFTEPQLSSVIGEIGER